MASAWSPRDAQESSDVELCVEMAVLSFGPKGNCEGGDSACGEVAAGFRMPRAWLPAAVKANGRIPGEANELVYPAEPMDPTEPTRRWSGLMSTMSLDFADRLPALDSLSNLGLLPSACPACLALKSARYCIYSL